jgi:hypothetical protein
MMICLSRRTATVERLRASVRCAFFLVGLCDRMSVEELHSQRLAMKSEKH